MIELIEKHRTALAELCPRYRVKTLDVFGSAADGTFEPARSDLDFLVEFLPLQTGEYADTYFGLLHALEGLFCRKIDLVIPTAIRNRYLLQSVNQQRKVIYGSSGSRAFVSPKYQ